MTNPDIDFNVDDIFLRYEQEQLLPLNNVPAENFADTKTVTGHDGEPKTFGLVDGVAYALPQSYSTTSYFPPHPEGDSGEVVKKDKDQDATSIIRDTASALVQGFNIRKDTGTAVLKGSSEALRETKNFLASVIGAPADLGAAAQNFVMKEVFGSDYEIPATGGSQEIRSGIDSFLNWVTKYIPFRDDIKSRINEPYTYEIYGRILEGVSQFATPAIPAATIARAFIAANPIIRGYIWGAFADAAAFPAEQELTLKAAIDYFDKDKTDHWEEMGETKQATDAERNQFVSMMMSLIEKNKDDPEIVNRGKLALEGLVIGGTFEGLVKLIPLIARKLPWKVILPALAAVSATPSSDAESSVLTGIFKGLTGDPKKISGNLRKLLARQKNLQKGKPLPGAPNHRRMVLKAPNKNLPDMVVGDITFSDWIARTEKMLGKDEIIKASRFYEDTFEVFLKHTGGDEALAEKYMNAWLVANQNITPTGAIQNVLLQAEQFARSVPIEKMKAGGLPEPTLAARSVLKGESIERGVGQKIFDFVDSAHKKDTRAWMDNNSAGGKPFVVDIHTGRDTGLVDETLINHLKRIGYDTTKLEKAQKGKPFDFTASIGETKYENRSDFGRRLTNYLNEIGWQGRSDWQPREIQAIGWGSMTKLTGDVVPSVDEALIQSTRRISFEIEPGAGSPWATKYNDRWNKLPFENRTAITKTVGNRAMEMAAKASGIDLRRIVHATGGWTYEGQTGQTAAAVAETYASKEGIKLAASYLGYLTNQTAVWINTIKNATKSPTGFAIDFVETGSRNLDSNKAVLKFWDEIVDADKDGVFGGYQMIRGADGEPVMRLLVQKKKGISGQKLRTQIDAAIANNIDPVLDNQSFVIDIFRRDADIVITGNDWKKVKDGKGYRSRVAKIGGRSTAGNLNRDGKELTKLLDSEIGKAEGGTKAKSGDGQVDNGFGQQVIPLRDDSLKSSLPTTKFLVSEIKKAVPNAQFGLNKSQTQMGPSDYLHIKVPGKPKIEIRLSNHGTGVRRTMDYFNHFPDYIPKKGKPEFGKISRESFDKRINEVINFLKNK